MKHTMEDNITETAIKINKQIPTNKEALWIVAMIRVIVCRLSESNNPQFHLETLFKGAKLDLKLLIGKKETENE